MKLAMFGCLAILTSSANAFDSGTWTELSFDPDVWNSGWPIHAKHLALDKNKNLIAWGNAGDYANNSTVYRVYESSGYTTWANISPTGGSENNLFCSGHVWSVTPDGDPRLLLFGGHRVNDDGTSNVNWFTIGASSSTWFTIAPGMDYGRWYPTAVPIWTGRYLVIGGTYGGESNVTLAEEAELHLPDVDWISGTQSYWRSVSNPGPMDKYYPFVFQDPSDGNLIYTHQGPTSRNGLTYNDRKYNLATGQWTDYNNAYSGINNAERIYPSAILIQNYKGTSFARLIKSGGGDTVARYQNNSALPWITTTYTRTVFSNLLSSPAWTQADAMELSRCDHTLVATPTGHVIAMGGAYQFPFGVPNGGLGGDPTALANEKSRTQPEVINALASNFASENWKLLAQIANEVRRILRGYHSTAILLPSGKIVIAGGENEGLQVYPFQNVAQIFSPPYGGRNDWDTASGVRPVLSGSTPSEMRYGENYVIPSITKADGKSIDKICLISLGSTTHAFNQSQTVVFLDFSYNSGTGEYTVTPPTSPKVAVPGYYMLFAVDNAWYGDTTPGSTDPHMVGVPSEAKIIRLRDFDRFLMSSATLISGTSATSTDRNQLLLQENQYFGGGLQSGASMAEVEASGTSPFRDNATKLRIDFETRVSMASLLLNVSVYNWSTSQWVDITTIEPSTTDTFHSVLVTSGVTNYIKSSPHTVKVKLSYWSDILPVTFNAYLDVLDVSVR